MSDKCPKCGTHWSLGVGDPWCSKCQKDATDIWEEHVAGLEHQLADIREVGAKLQSALDQIDTLCMTPEEVARDIEAVGGPVSFYCVDYDEDRVVRRVGELIKALREELATEKEENRKLQTNQGCGCWQEASNAIRSRRENIELCHCINHQFVERCDETCAWCSLVAENKRLRKQMMTM